MPPKRAATKRNYKDADDDDDKEEEEEMEVEVDDDDDDDDDEEDDEEEEEQPKKKAKVAAKKKPAAKKKAASAKEKASKAKKAAPKKAATKKTTKAKGKAAAKSTKKATKAKSADKTPKVKVFTKFDRLEEARKAYKWWEAPPLPEGINWRTLEHPGITFPPSYVPHGIPMKYDGVVVTLTPEQEELASFYAAMPEDGPQLGNANSRPVFQRNFFEDFKVLFPAGHVVKKFNLCDFSLIKEHLDLQKNLRKAASQEEKDVKKAEKEVLTLKYGFAIIDGRLEKMGNYNMEPPGLFRGRGEHPKTGMLKKRCMAESVSLNLADDAPVPKCSTPGHAWMGIRHDPGVTWLCNWNENVNNQSKYVQLAASSSFKGKSDSDKYGTAIKLRGHVDKVRRVYKDHINSSDKAKRQLGVAMWVIDILALRVGGEKDDKNEADTVGCCSLRVEHLTFNSDPSSKEIELEFLGKDSMLYKQTIDFSKYGPTGELVYSRLRSFCANKSKKQDVFETLTPSDLNSELSSLMPGLTAKVFRTYNASVTLEKELPTADSMRELSVQEKVVQYNAANREVAILCNHQKTVSKATEIMFENLNEKLNQMKSQQEELKEWLALAKKKKEAKIPLKDDDKEHIDSLNAQLKECQKAKETAKITEEKLNAANALEDIKAEIKKDQARRFGEKHMYKTTPNATQLQSRIDKWGQDIQKMETDIRNRDENKEVSLGTSKINYMDPRISVAWCKRCEVPIDRVFAKTLRDKFNWAMAVPPDWKFE